MFFTYLRRELTKRRKQTILISSGMAVAIALVLIVSGLGNGIKSAQAQALSGLYGVGTDISVSKTQAPGAGDFRQRFQIGAGQGSTNGQTRTFNRSNLRTQFGVGTLTDAQVKAVQGEALVKAAVATLKLNSITFNGTLPTFNQSTGSNSNTGTNGLGGNAGQNGLPSTGSNPQPSFGGSTQGGFHGGFDGNGGSQFDVSSFSVEGVPTDVLTAGPLYDVTINSGRTFTAADANAYNVVLDKTYATGQSLKVGSTVTIASKKFTVIGIVQSKTASSTASNAYVPIALAQTLSSNSGAYTNVYVTAKDSSQISTLKAAIKKDVSGATVSSQDDLASSVSGSLGTASSLTNSLGGWLAAVVLLAAFATAILFTTSGVNRRVREFGTLKAIGWRSNRIVRQVVGESIVNGLIGGVFGVVLGTAGVFVINAFGPTLSAGVASATRGFGGFPGGGNLPGGGLPGGGPFGRMAASTATNIQLTAAIEPYMFILAIAFALIGGLLAGAIGGLRAAKLSPAEALRSVA